MTMTAPVPDAAPPLICAAPGCDYAAPDAALMVAHWQNDHPAPAAGYITDAAVASELASIAAMPPPDGVDISTAACVWPQCRSYRTGECARKVCNVPAVAPDGVPAAVPAAVCGHCARPVAHPAVKYCGRIPCQKAAAAFYGATWLPIR